MGESKRRGTRQERADQVRSRIFQKLSEDMPSDMRCNKCNAVLVDVVSYPEFIKHGLTHVYAAACKPCDSVTFACAGTQEAMISFALFLEDEFVSPPLIGACLNVGVGQ
jgi:hypothetical protein